MDDRLIQLMRYEGWIIAAAPKSSLPHPCATSAAPTARF
jgi:hypothetical protein